MNRPTTLKQTAVRAALGDHDARLALDQARLAELFRMPQQAFEGTPESGPMTPRTAADAELSTARSAIRRVRIDAALGAELAVATLAGADISDAALFAAAAYADVSPLFALRRASEVIARPFTPADEARIEALMQAQEDDAR